MKRFRLNYLLGAMAFALAVSSCSKMEGYNFENGFSSGEFVDTVGPLEDNDANIDYSKYTQARLFPGMMSSDEPRLEHHKVSIDLDYLHVPSSDLRISVSPGSWQSTGMYAPTGERIEIEVPEGVYGLTVQIGAHVATSATDIENPQRDLIIYSRKDLFPGKNYVRNLYGGMIYILPSRPLGRVIDLFFTGAAKAPSFKLGVTDPVAWQEEIKNSTVPWFEMESNRIVFTLQTAKAQEYGIPQPQELMETWDKMIKEAYWDWTGLTEGNPNPKHRAPFNKWRIVHDVLFKRGVAQVSGYPVRALATENYFRQATDVDQVKYSNWGTYHEIGHNMQQGSTWSFDGNGEVTCNLFSFKVSNLNGQQHSKIASVWNKAVPYLAARKHKGAGKDSVNWASMDVEGNAYKSAAHDIRLMMYAQIFEKYGYDFTTYIYKRARNARFTSANNQSKIDFFYESLSEFTQIDMEPYLRMGWGLTVSNVSKRYVSEELNLPLLDHDVWNFNPVTRTGGNGPLPVYRTDVSRTGWTATIFPQDHLRNDFPLTNLFDGNASSIWHVGTVKTFPYHITVVSPNDIHADGFYFQGRSGFLTRYITDYAMEVRANASSAWEEVPMDGGTSLAIMNNNAGKAYIKFADGQSRTFREFRLNIRGASNQDVALAELGVWKFD